MAERVVRKETKKESEKESKQIDFFGNKVPQWPIVFYSMLHLSFWFLLKYFSIWILFSIIFFLLMSYFLHVEKDFLAADTLIQNIIMASLMIGIWYPINYMTWENQKISLLIFNHLLLFLLFIITWISLTHFCLRSDV